MRQGSYSEILILATPSNGDIYKGVSDTYDNWHNYTVRLVMLFLQVHD